MRAGKIASVLLVLIVTVLASVVHMVEGAFTGTSVNASHAGVFALVALGSSAVVFLPLGVILDRTLLRLQRSIESAANPPSSSSASSAGGAGGVPIPIGIECRFNWLRPLTRALTGAIDRLRLREQQLRAQQNDLEIRHRVAESQRRQIEAALNALGDGVIVTDPFNEIAVVNEAAGTILGFDRAAALHKSIEDVIGDERVRQLIREVRAAGDFNHPRKVELEGIGRGEVSGQKSEVSTQHSALSTQSSVRVFDVSVMAVANHKGEVGGVVTILHDLTRIREISQMKSDFVSKASHELRTPLSSIRAYVEMLVDGEAADDRARQEFYRIMQGETDRLGRLIDNMLNISRIEAGIVQIQREQVDMKRLIERAVHTIQPQADEKGIAVHCRIPNVDVSVEGDADMLYQVVLNLMSNAVKYTPGNSGSEMKVLGSEIAGTNAANAATGGAAHAGNRITVAADTDNLTRSVVVSVSDTGLGIPPDALPKLFDKFFRIENYKRVAKGTGLGLNLCKHIVETVHHGQIGVDSKLGMGSKFWFSVPMRYAGSDRGEVTRGRTQRHAAA